MKLLLSLLVGVLLVCSTCLGQVPEQGEQQANVYSFKGWKAGSYNVSLVIGESGQIVSITSLTVVSVPPPSTTPPPPPTDSARIKRIKAVVPNDAETSKNIAGLSSVLATKARAGEFQTAQQLSDVFKTSMNFLLEDPSRNQKWSAVWKKTAAGSEGVVADEWIAVAQRGGTIADYAALLDDISIALGGNQLEGFDIATIIELVGIIMKGDLQLADFIKIAELVMRLFS